MKCRLDLCNLATRVKNQPIISKLRLTIIVIAWIHCDWRWSDFLRFFVFQFRSAWNLQRNCEGAKNWVSFIHNSIVFIRNFSMKYRQIFSSDNIVSQNRTTFLLSSINYRSTRAAVRCGIFVPCLFLFRCNYSRAPHVSSFVRSKWTTQMDSQWVIRNVLFETLRTYLCALLSLQISESNQYDKNE